MNKTAEPRVQYVSFEELLEEDGYLVYTNVGCSMMPLLRQRRDIIEIRGKGSERCKSLARRAAHRLLSPLKK